jgi:hypothetical protein
MHRLPIPSLMRSKTLRRSPISYNIPPSYHVHILLGMSIEGLKAGKASVDYWLMPDKFRKMLKDALEEPNSRNCRHLFQPQQD